MDSTKQTPDAKWRTGSEKCITTKTVSHDMKKNTEQHKDMADWTLMAAGGVRVPK